MDDTGGVERDWLRRVYEGLGALGAAASIADGDPAELLVCPGTRLRADVDRGSVTFRVESAAPGCNGAEVVDLARAIARAALLGAPMPIRLEARGMLLRHRARQAGFLGTLRGPLTWARPVPAPRADEALAQMVAELVSGVSVVVDASAGLTRRFARMATSGLARPVLLVISDASGYDVRCIVPGDSQLLPESIARAIDVTVGVRRRFARELRLLRMISFDRGSRGFVTGKHAGIAQTNARLEVHINADLVTVDGVERMRDRGLASPSSTPPARVAAPFDAIDGTAAHELWHQIDAEFQRHHFRESVEFRRRLGEELGVDTLERAFGRSADASVARERVVAEVSPYAATRAGEATAEMFKLWWCRSGPLSPLVARFGELIDEFFPADR